ncbi:translation initiation factor IF-2-like [Acinonyx jubatus]|uniref:Translation initiation factor IF-2-like n=1 Tax=Acinonyx jubatus TaxID=32536 RepID=A0ABM3Q1R7_ACIJB|nr:translation initiation factor IF-2-like [Acinonyx jubatus]
MAAKFLTKPKDLLLVWCWRITISRKNSCYLTMLRKQFECEKPSWVRRKASNTNQFPNVKSQRAPTLVTLECPSSPETTGKRVPKQVLYPRSTPPPALGVRAPHGSTTGPVPPPPKPGGQEPATLWGPQGACRGSRFSVPPAPRRSAPGAAQTPGRPDQGQELGLPAPPTQPPSPRQCKPAGKPAGELPAEAQARRLQRRAGLCGGRPAALRPPAAARSSRSLPLPRRLQHRAAEARGRRKPEEGGPGQGQRPHDSSSADQAGELGKARRRAESEAPGRALPSALGSGSQATAPSASGAAGSLLLLVCWRQTRGDHGRPRVHGGRCTAERGCGGSAPPGAGRQESSRAPTFRAGRTPAARPCRASGTENHHDGRARVKQRVASGQDLQGMHHQRIL